MDKINVDKAVEFVLTCMNFDGGFGCRPGSESHAGQVSLLMYSNSVLNLNSKSCEFHFLLKLKVKWKKSGVKLLVPT